MDLGVLVTPGVATREALAPAEVLVERLGVRAATIGFAAGTVAGHDPSHRFDVEATTSEFAGQVLLVPGGFGALELTAQPEVVRWLDGLVASGTAVLTVSTGSLLVAATGRLRGVRVAGHWLCDAHLRPYGAIPSSHAMETHGRIVTTSGTAAALGGAEFLADLVRWGAGSTWEETAAGV